MPPSAPCPPRRAPTGGPHPGGLLPRPGRRAARPLPPAVPSSGGPRPGGPSPHAQARPGRRATDLLRLLRSAGPVPGPARSGRNLLCSPASPLRAAAPPSIPPWLSSRLPLPPPTNTSSLPSPPLGPVLPPLARALLPLVRPVPVLPDPRAGPPPLRLGQHGGRDRAPPMGPSPPRVPPLPLVLWRLRFPRGCRSGGPSPANPPCRWSSIRTLSSISRLLHWSPIRDTPSPPSPLPARSTRRGRHFCGTRPSCGSASARQPTLSLLRLP
jgi:hypothetical protein